MGRPTSFVEVAVVDDDDAEVPERRDRRTGGPVLECRGDLLRYWNKPDATLTAFRNLWYHTGDYGRRLPDGFFTFVDRKKDAMRRRGENVSSIELERAITAHPAVLEAPCTPCPRDLGEDDIKACVVVAGGCQLDLDELFDFFKDQPSLLRDPALCRVSERVAQERSRQSAQAQVAR